MACLRALSACSSARGFLRVMLPRPEAWQSAWAPRPWYARRDQLSGVRTMLSFVRRHWLMFVVIAVVGCPFALWGVNNFLWLGMEDWQSLVGSYLAIIAGLFVILAAVIQSQSEERGRRASLLNERRSLATALLAEVRAITLSLKGHQKYLREFRGKLEREPALAQSSSWEGHHFAVINAGVFAAHVGRIGALPYNLVGKIVAFYGGLASWD